MKLMKHTKWVFYLFLVTQSLLLYPRGEVDPIDRSSLTADLLAAVNESNRLLTLIEINTLRTANNTQGAEAAFLDTTSTWPLTITPSTSGNTFKFTENVSVSTVTTGGVIVISKDNVTIDLCGQTLSLASSVTTAVSGIVIAAGVKGTQIISTAEAPEHKGTIQGFTASAVRLEGSSASPIKNTLLNDVVCSYNTQGIFAEYSDNTSITNSKCVGSQNLLGNVYGIYMKNIKNTIIDNVESSENNSKQSAFGIYLENSNSATVKNCTTNLNYSTGEHTTRGSSYGVYVTASGTDTSSSNAILDCEANENYHISNAIVVKIQESVGFMVTTVLDGTSTTKSNTLNNCQARRNISKEGTNIPTAGFGHGIKLYNSSDNEVRSCTCSYNSTHGVIDSYPPTDTTPVSTSFFTSNICFFNTQDNYNVIFQEEPGTGDGTTPIKTVKIYIGNQIALQESLQGYANVEIISK